MNETIRMTIYIKSDVLAEIRKHRAEIELATGDKIALNKVVIAPIEEYYAQRKKGVVNEAIPRQKRQSKKSG